MDNQLYLLKNGSCVLENETRRLDLLIKSGKIAELGELNAAAYDNVQVIDCEGKYILPGFIDAHTHFDLDVAGTTTIDDFESGTKAAVVGGTTTVIDFAHQYHGESLSEGVNNWHKKAQKGKLFCNYGLHLAITELSDSFEQDIKEIIDSGISSFKLYMTYDVMVSDHTIHRILRALKPYGAIVGMHCENDGIVAALRDEVSASQLSCVYNHYKTRPEVAEAEAVNRFICISKSVDIPVMIVHLTSKDALEVIQNARKSGLKVLAETCPQYLLLEKSVYDKDGLDAAKYVISPPLREAKDRAALWEALQNEEIQTVATDHCSFSLKQKSAGAEDYRKIPGGMPGAEARGLLMLEHGVKSGRLSLNQVSKLLSTNPAKIYGMYPERGCISIDSTADIVIVDPKGGTRLSADTQISKCDYSPFEGEEVSCSIDDVFLSGIHVVHKGQLLTDGSGSFIKRHRPDSDYDSF